MLIAEQERAVQRPIRDRTPDQLKMGYALWTRQAVAELIRDRYDIKLAVRAMGLYLEYWGLSSQKPLEKACEQSPTAVRKALDEECPAMAAGARAEGAEIHRGDDAGLCIDNVRGRSYVPQGQTSVIRANNRHHGLSAISAVTSKGQMRRKAFGGAHNANILIDFLCWLVKDADRKVSLILDSMHERHRQPVTSWLSWHEREIRVFCLTSHSLGFNSNETSNADFKQSVSKLSMARIKSKLVKAASRLLRSVQQQPERIKIYCRYAPVRYAACVHCFNAGSILIMIQCSSFWKDKPTTRYCM